MPAEQGILTPAIRTILAFRAPLHTVAVNCDGLHHRTPNVRRMQPALGNYRLIYKDGPFCPIRRRKKNGGRPSGHLRQGGMEITWTPHWHCVRPRLAVDVRGLERIPQAIRDWTPDFDSLSPTDRWTNRASQSNH